MIDPSEAQVASWSKNVEKWTAAVRGRTIASRRDATDAAILSAARAGRLGKLLDVGCGEGWLCRELSGDAAAILGVDASAELIAHARERGRGARYLTLTFAELAETPARAGQDFDTVVCNFSLLDDQAEALLDALASISNSRARLLIQTLHPIALTPYEDGWRLERFEGFGDAGWAPMPYYARTLASWVGALAPKWTLKQIIEPKAPSAQTPASLLLISERC